MLSDVKLFWTCLVAFAALDYLWIGIVLRDFYVEQMRDFGRIYGFKFEPILWAAIIVYILLSIAIVKFALPKVTALSGWSEVFLIGALLGSIIYGVYDFTNYSVIKEWTLQLAIADLLWGTVLCGIVTCIARFVRDGM